MNLKEWGFLILMVPAVLITGWFFAKLVCR